MAELTIEHVRKGQAVWVTVSGPVSRTKRAANAADSAARRIAVEAGQRGAYLRAVQHKRKGERFTYRAIFAIG